VGEGQITWRHAPDDGNLNSYHRQKRKAHKCAVHFLSSCTECKAVVLKVQYYRANKILVPATYIFKNVEIKRFLKLALADVENLNVAAFRENVADVALLCSKGVVL